MISCKGELVQLNCIMTVVNSENILQCNFSFLIDEKNFMFNKLQDLIYFAAPEILSIKHYHENQQ